jgi:hypothetical protein
MELICRSKTSVKASAWLGEHVDGMVLKLDTTGGVPGSKPYRQTCIRMILSYRDQHNHEGVSEGGHSRQVLQSQRMVPIRRQQLLDH